ncbi:MAG TPA: DNA-3-methyladenine glycosylase [Candidatus Limnocylindrales bacterium]|nr:DNA-3-methyladenine glycosylase [Candidatus Limnocylindrales bacterium]
MFRRPTLEVAPALIGLRLVRAAANGTPARAGRIVEVEAYIGEDDRASHARFGKTARNAIMFGRAGLAYVYLVYGMYDCLNIVTEPRGRPAAVLVRAVEPLEGAAAMRDAREAWWRTRRAATPEAAATERQRLDATPDTALARGPGLVAAAFGIDRTMTGLDLLDPASPLRLERAPAGAPTATVEATPRVGIAYAGAPWIEIPWRFVDAASPSVSGPRRPATR